MQAQAEHKTQREQEIDFCVRVAEQRRASMPEGDRDYFDFFVNFEVVGKIDWCTFLIELGRDKGVYLDAIKAMVKIVIGLSEDRIFEVTVGWLQGKQREQVRSEYPELEGTLALLCGHRILTERSR